MTKTQQQTKNRLSAIGPDPSNGALEFIEYALPYRVQFTLTGVCDLLFHAWNCESVEAKSRASKGSKAKKTDDVESYVYRNDKGELCIPGENVLQSVIGAAKYRQDPRSPRKSAMDLFKAGIVNLTIRASLGIKHWDYEHKGPVQINRARITRVRPALKEGWVAEFIFLVNLPEYIGPQILHDTLVNAGRLIGVCDHRPSYGRYSVTAFKVLED